MGLLAAELRKLWSVRTTWAVTVLGWGLVTLSTSVFLFNDQFTGRFDGSDAQVAAAVEQILASSVIVLIVAILLVTTEFRHGTVGRALQLDPSRTRFLLAKLGGGVVYGIAYHLTSLVIVALLLLLATTGAGVDLEIGGEALRAVWQGPAAMALNALLGVAVGTLLRNQVLALTLALIWNFVVESVVVQIVPGFGRWLPFQALNAVFVSEEAMGTGGPGPLTPLDPPLALAVLLGYVVLFGLPAVLLMRLRDV